MDFRNIVRNLLALFGVLTIIITFGAALWFTIYTASNGLDGGIALMSKLFL